MFNSDTVFILGAGSSAPLGFPCGDGLRSDILKQGHDILAKCWTDEHTGITIDDFTKDFRDSHLPIDAFLERRPEYQRMGKLCIAYLLVKWETEEYFHKPDNWYPAILSAINARKDDLTKNRLHFITFNYDRSLEHFLYLRLQMLWKLSETELLGMLAHFEVTHLHGQLGHLPWQVKKGEAVRLYSATMELAQIEAAADGIKIASEVQPTEEILRAKRLLQRAQHIYIIGFGFDPSNVARIGLTCDGDKTVWGTCYGMSHTRTEALRNKYKGLEFVGPSDDGLKFFHQCRPLIEELL